LDCRIERSNVFEDICALLSKTAFPVNCPLRSVHLISLEGLLAVLNTLSSMIGPGAGEEDVVMEAGQYYADLWTALVEGREPRPGKNARFSPSRLGAHINTRTHTDECARAHRLLFSHTYIHTRRERETGK
jgi:hypothetical protein